MLKQKNADFEEAAKRWAGLLPMVSVIKTEKRYQHSLQFLDYLLDEVRDDSNHPWSDLLDLLGVLIEKYETLQKPLPEAAPQDVLKYLMGLHDLTQSELPEIGSQGVVSEILRGKRELNVRQIKSLAKRFKVNATLFIA